ERVVERWNYRRDCDGINRAEFEIFCLQKIPELNAVLIDRPASLGCQPPVRGQLVSVVNPENRVCIANIDDEQHPWMISSPKEISMSDVVPMLAYEDGFAALEWLTRVFGFRERKRMTAPDGRLSHGELECGDGLVMLGTPSPDYHGPRKHREECQQAK